MSQTDQQVIQLVTTALETALALAQEEAGWKVEKEQDGATVKSKKNGDGRKVWLCTAMVDLPVQKLWAKLQDTDNLTSWNTTLTQSRTLKTLPGGVKVTYQVTTEGGGGVVSARDFVYGSTAVARGDMMAIGGLSVNVAEDPTGTGCVRAVHGPGCQLVRPVPGNPGQCRFDWLMDCDYKGMIPSSIVEIAMPSAQLQMVECIKKLA